jgi:hypothetical protein
VTPQVREEWEAQERSAKQRAQAEEQRAEEQRAAAAKKRAAEKRERQRLAQAERERREQGQTDTLKRQVEALRGRIKEQANQQQREPSERARIAKTDAGRPKATPLLQPAPRVKHVYAAGIVNHSSRPLRIEITEADGRSKLITLSPGRGWIERADSQWTLRIVFPDGSRGNVRTLPLAAVPQTASQPIPQFAIVNHGPRFTVQRAGMVPPL